MFLNDDERTIFFKLYFGLLVWVNNKHKIVDGFTKEKYPESVDSKAAYSIREKMFQRPEWIDEYLSCVGTGELTEPEREIILSWRKHFIMGQFIVMRHLARYSVFMAGEHTDTAKLYGIAGISHPFSDFYERPALPVIVNAVILPFQDKIIYDGLFSAYNIIIGPGMRRNLNDSYRASKEKYGIIERLPFDGFILAPKTARKSPAKPLLTDSANQTRDKAEAITPLITKFCEEKLGTEFIQPCLYALEKLRRKRPSPLLTGKANTWACGIVYAVASNNFVFDRSQPYFMTAQDIADGFGLSKSTAQNKSAEVNNLLNITPVSSEYVIESLREERESLFNMFSMTKVLKKLK